MNLQKLQSHRDGCKRVIEQYLNTLQDADSIPLTDFILTLKALEKKITQMTALNDDILSKLEAENVEEEMIAVDTYTLELDIKIHKLHEIRNEREGNLQTSSAETIPRFEPTGPTPSSPAAEPVSENHAQYQQNNQNNSQSQTLSNTSFISNSSQYHRLPKLTLPTFTGDILQWQSFWDSFETAVHSNTSLSNVQKFNYLKCSLSQEALQTIAGFALTNSNYERAVSLLHERYGQKDKIIQTYMNALMEIPAPEFTVPSLRRFYDTTETYIRGLESLDQPISTYGSLLTPVMLRKLPPQVRQNITRAHGSQSWCLTDLMHCLQTEISVLDSGSPSVRYDPMLSTATFLTKSDSHAIQPPENNNNSNKTYSRSQTRPVNKGKNEQSNLCVYCKGNHSSSNCSNITDYSQKLEIVKKNKLCFNCLGKHKVSDCRSRFSCKLCKRRHHTSLCNEKDESAHPSKNSSNSHNAKENHTSVLHSAHSINTGPVLLKTAVSTVASESYSCEANILFDEGSQSSFITEKTANKLNLESRGKETISISGFGDSERRVRHLDYAFVHLETSCEKITIKVLIVPEISVPIKTYTKEMHTISYLKGLQLAHPVTNSDEFSIELLIGADFYWSIVLDEVIRGDGPTAMKSKIGYLLSGPLQYTDSNPTRPLPISMMNVLTMRRQEEIDIEKFWEVESMGLEQNEKCSDYDEYTKQYQDTCITYEDGKYIAKLPWKVDHAALPSNELISRCRTQNVINRLSREPDLLQKYSEIITDQEKKGFIEKVENDTQNVESNVHYIPHHYVKKDSITTPIRIVYDCSCKSTRDSPSLNECLMNTPPQLNDLTTILLRFRQHKFAVTTDIEKAFLNISLHPDDRDVTRFFWLSDPNDPNSRLQTYRFKSVLFGATCSPFILNATIMKHLDLHQCDITQQICQGLYVDNILTSIQEETALFDYYSNSRDLFKQAAFNLRSWSTNNSTLQQKIEIDGVNDKEKLTKVLGMRWNSATDEMSFPQRFPSLTDNSCLTKRVILQELSSVYDPLGLISPVTVNGKMLIQLLWRQKHEWDIVLPQDIISGWCKLREDITEATKIKFSRCYFGDSTSEKATLHIFSDASIKAYGACAYLVYDDKSTLVMAKNRVAPLKKLTVPKLELCAALIGARLGRHILSSINCENVIFWSDSQIVLSWITSHKQLPLFVSRRVSEIKELTNKFQWRYCPTSDNPADLLSRGLTYDKFRDNGMWFNGPEWLTDESKFPISDLETQKDDCYMKDTNVTVLSNMNANATEPIPGIFRVVNVDRFSSYHKLLRVCTYVLRFIDICKKKRRFHEQIEPRDINITSNLLIKHAQQQEFADEIKHLGGSALKSPKPTLIRQLDLYLDDENLLRCGGRIANAPLPENTRFPYLLPSKGKFTELIILDAHSAQLHSGVGNTITYLRQRFWIPRIRQRVKDIIRRCVTCRKVSGAPYRVPDPPPLPSDRLKEAPPFTVTGVDFTGALTVKGQDGTLHKAYVCLFTCANTRAVHLEIVRDMSVEAFMLALRRLFSRKSTPKIIMSDNALTFLAASKILKDEILDGHSITWKFIPQHAPWYGGWWERLIGITKTCLKKVLGKSLISLDVLQTIATEVESIINDRPLTYTSSDHLDPEPLTPSQLLYGRRITSPVYPSDTSAETTNTVTSNASANKLFRFKSATIERFWSVWRHEYLTSLRQFHRASGNRGDVVSVGDVVLIQDDVLPRSRWCLGVIKDVIVGGDGSIRAATVKSRRGVTTRPIAKLYPLELQ